MRTILASGLLLASLPVMAASQERPATPPVSFSGIIVGSYQYLTGGTNRDFNQFNLDRAYLNVRAPAGDRVSIRITTDVFRSTPEDQGWAIRAKYAYVDYAFPASRGLGTTLRAGILQNVIIEHTDRIWLRPLSTNAVERHGAFASADAGVAADFQLGDRLGEAYFTIVNGTGFGRRETDRFKDFGGRLTLTPLARNTGSPLSTLMLTGWSYRGATASRFVAGGPDQVGPVASALARNRSGVQAAIRHPRLTALAEHAWFGTGTESGANTTASPRVMTVVDGTVTSGFVIPRAPVTIGGREPIRAVARYDHVVANRATDDRYHFLMTGLLYDVTTRATFGATYQEQLPNRGAMPAGVANLKAWTLHAAVTY